MVNPQATHPDGQPRPLTQRELRRVEEIMRKHPPIHHRPRRTVEPLHRPTPRQPWEPLRRAA